MLILQVAFWSFIAWLVFIGIIWLVVPLAVFFWEGRS